MRRYSRDEIESIASACVVGRRVLKSLRERCVSGASGREAVNACCSRELAHTSAIEFGPVTISINEAAANATPSDQPFKAGDLVTADVPLAWQGWWGDQARSFVVGWMPAVVRPTTDAERYALRCRLAAVSRRVTACSIASCRPGARWRDVRVAAWAEANRLGLRICRGLVGHGVGVSMHEKPALGYHAGPWDEIVLEPGMVFTVEPVVTTGAGATFDAADGGMVLTCDGKDTACDERAVAITGTGFRVL